ncbi:MAG: methyl-accepting chemotaxis protein [Thermodesulfovibrionales bacterium]
MFNNIKLGKRLGLGFGLLIVLILAIAGASVNGLKNVGGYLHEVIDERAQIDKLLVDTMDEINVVARSSFGVLLADNKSDIKQELARVSKAMQDIDENVDKISNMIHSSEEKELLNTFFKAKEPYDSAMKQFVTLMREGNKETAKKLRLGDIRKLQRESYMPAIENLLSHEQKLTKEAGINAEKAQVTALTTVFVCAVIALILAILFTFLITVSITRPLKEGVGVMEQLSKGNLAVDINIRSHDEVGQLLDAMKVTIENLKATITAIQSSAQSVASASEELSASSGQMSRGVAEQSGRSAQIATSSSEMSQTILDIAKNAADIASSAKEASVRAKDGKAIVNESAAEVNEIANSVSKSARLITSLGERSKQIGEIINVIKDIADQTNLLALNAAIEAARAGEQGRGFAVVADEVRKLAERTTKATSEIGGMIGAIQNEVGIAVNSMDEANNRVELGVQGVTKAGESLNTIVASVDSLQSMVQQIATATDEMSTVSETINCDIETIAKVSQDTSSGSGQIAASASDLARLSSDLQRVVGQFRMKQLVRST